MLLAKQLFKAAFPLAELPLSACLWCKLWSKAFKKAEKESHRLFLLWKYAFQCMSIILVLIAEYAEEWENLKFQAVYHLFCMRLIWAEPLVSSFEMENLDADCCTTDPASLDPASLFLSITSADISKVYLAWQKPQHSSFLTLMSVEFSLRPDCGRSDGL